MPLLGTQTVNARGHLEIAGCDTLELAQEFGTPLYVLDEPFLRQTCRDYQCAFEARYPNVQVSYASKALICTAVCRIVEQEGLLLDVASGGELYTALRAGIPAERIHLHGNFKSDAEVRMALEAGIERIIVDSEPELDQISRVAAELGTEATISIRVTPGIKPDTHHYIQVGQIDSKFGLGIQTGQAMAAIRHALQTDRIKLSGLHCHIGSQLFGLDSFAAAAELMCSFMAAVHAETGHHFEELNMGGGLGIQYVEADTPPAIDELAEVLVGALKEACSKYGVPEPRLALEPGRSIVGMAGVTLYRVGPVKEIPGVRTYVSVDGGLSDNPRPALYGAKYMVLNAGKAAEPPSVTVTVSGKHCETDTLFKDVAIAPAQPGDVLAVLSTGAYNYAMASNYNRFTRPAMVLVNDGRVDVIVERESLDQLVQNDRIPDRLA